jgi:hypothetical protein
MVFPAQRAKLNAPSASKKVVAHGWSAAWKGSISVLFLQHAADLESSGWMPWRSIEGVRAPAAGARVLRGERASRVCFPFTGRRDQRTVLAFLFALLTLSTAAVGPTWAMMTSRSSAT